jgi:hypothetical protein
MLLTVINNIISFLLTLAIVFVAPIMIAYAGFLYVVNAVDPSGISKAKGILVHTVVGIVIALAGWMIVDALMAVLYNPGASTGTSTLGAWANIVTGGDTCLSQAGLSGGLNQVATSTGNGAGNGALNPPPSGKAGTACDPAAVQAGAAAGGKNTLTNTQANILACIAKPESACGSNLNPPNYNWNSAKSSPGSTAAGAFQVLLSSNHSCYENTACYTAAGVGGPLNCQNGFDGSGNPKTDAASAQLVQTCLTAADNLNCSAAAAACLLAQNGGSFSAWTSDQNSSAQQACITNGG